jgi:predicted DNA-binding transcriptional regulator AlpA
MLNNRDYLRSLKALQAADLLGLTISDFLDKVESGDVPQPFFDGMGRRWNEHELKEWKRVRAQT